MLYLHDILNNPFDFHFMVFCLSPTHFNPRAGISSPSSVVGKYDEYH